MKRLSMVMLIMLLAFLTACGGGGNESASPGNTNTEGSTEGSGEAEAPKVNFRLGHVASEISVYHVPALEFKRLVEEKTNGNVTIDIFPGAQLGGDRDMLENVMNGSLDIGWISLAIFDAVTPVFSGFQLPFLITDNDTAYQAFASETADKALATMDKFNVHALEIVQGGLRQFATNNDPIRTPADAQGQSIRAPQSQMILDALNKLGMSPTPIPYPELYSALQTGVIDGSEQPIVTFYSDKYYEVVKNISVSNIYPWPAVITFSNDAWNKMSEEQQQAVREAAVETQTYMSTKLIEMEAEALEFLKTNGKNTVVEDVDVDAFKEIMIPIQDEYAAKDPLIKETVDLVRDIYSKK